MSQWRDRADFQLRLSESDHACVRKCDNSYRLCVDYQRLNKKIVKDRLPPPLIEDQLDQLQDARFFQYAWPEEWFLLYEDESSESQVHILLRSGRPLWIYTRPVRTLQLTCGILTFRECRIPRLDSRACSICLYGRQNCSLRWYRDWNYKFEKSARNCEQAWSNNQLK